mmetsp:Transcript_5750/g.13930  ORF Transcript_5750/g.13930 Transcript_5750/m.13930 type:complete len:216 (+) Transcript_5750:1151-1798(+)
MSVEVRRLRKRCVLAHGARVRPHAIVNPAHVLQQVALPPAPVIALRAPERLLVPVHRPEMLHHIPGLLKRRVAPRLRAPHQLRPVVHPPKMPHHELRRRKRRPTQLAFRRQLHRIAATRRRRQRIRYPRRVCPPREVLLDGPHGFRREADRGVDVVGVAVVAGVRGRRVVDLQPGERDRVGTPGPLGAAEVLVEPEQADEFDVVLLAAFLLPVHL